MKNFLKKIGGAGQWFGLLAVTTGLFFQVQTNAPKGYIAIAAGSIIFALFTKFKHETEG